LILSTIGYGILKMDQMSDEINIVDPGFNSRWENVMGHIALSGVAEADLVNFPGSQYVDSVLNWRQPVEKTDLEFLSSTQLGPNL
jgi:aldose sugar dehydrogenase